LCRQRDHEEYAEVEDEVAALAQAVEELDEVLEGFAA
jgi:hypothetical protein